MSPTDEQKFRVDRVIARIVEIGRVHEAAERGVERLKEVAEITAALARFNHI